MIQLSYDFEHNTVIVQFAGKIDVEQGKRYLPKIRDVIPKGKKGFTLLVDLSLLEEMDPKIQKVITEAMDIFNMAGVTKIVRVIPNPSKDIGFNILSVFHYAKHVNIVTVQSREEAIARL